MPPEPPLNTLIEQYLAGELSADQAERVRAYIDAHPGRRGLVAGWRAATLSTHFGPAPDATISRNAMLARLAALDEMTGQSVEARAQIVSRAPASTYNGTNRTPSSTSFRDTMWGGRARWSAGAAVFGAVILLAFGMSRNAFVRTPIPARVYTTAAGERMALTLADGSRVILAPRTELRISDSSQVRSVAIRGEAYFDVVPGRAPFVVQSGNARVDVLGTTFDVRQYEDDGETSVAVVTGKVALSALHANVRMATSPRRLILTAGAVGRVTDSTVIATGGDVLSYAAWTDGKLTFRSVPVRDVLTTLGRWYDYRFTLTDSALAQRPVTGSFDYGSSADMLSALKILLDVTMTFDHRTVVLHPRDSYMRAPVRRTVRDSLVNVQRVEQGR